MFNLFKINTKSNKNFKMSIIMEVRYFDETKKFDFIERNLISLIIINNF